MSSSNSGVVDISKLSDLSNFTELTFLSLELEFIYRSIINMFKVFLIYYSRNSIEDLSFSELFIIPNKTEWIRYKSLVFILFSSFIIYFSISNNNIYDISALGNISLCIALENLVLNL